MNDIVEQYVDLKKNLMYEFNCNEDYFIRCLLKYKWSILNKDGVFFLSYWKNEKKIDAVIVKKDNEPLIYKNENYIMIIAIDCIKIAFILKNSNMK